jgi:hypothetical protein
MTLKVAMLAPAVSVSDQESNPAALMDNQCGADPTISKARPSQFPGSSSTCGLATQARGATQLL